MISSGVVFVLCATFCNTSPALTTYSSFSGDGVQYLAVVSGWGVDPAFQQGLLSNLLGWQKDVPQGGVVWVFALAP